MLKLSRFNFWATVGENQYLLFNGITGALYELTAEERIQVHRLLNAPSNPSNSDETELHRLLVEEGFIIPDDLDEIEVLLNRNRLECVDHRILDLIISPTYGCNFRCAYCYVDFKVERMSRDTEDRAIKYIERMLPQYHQINITWFGGEPLLCLDTVLRVSKHISEIARRHEVRLYNLISTNGYLLELETVRKLYEAGIRFFHITIDGPPQYHDQLRVLVDGNPSYAKIIENLRTLLTFVSGAHLTLRMNVDESNVKSVREVLDEIPAAFRRRIQVNVTPILYEDRTPSAQLYLQINQAIRYALESGYLYYDVQIPIKRRTFCPADKHNNFHIGPDGTLYKCSPGKDKPEVKVGRLGDEGLLEISESYRVWHGVPVVSEHCLDCPYLCFCAGGCRLERLRGTRDLSCRDRYTDIENMIINRYVAILNDAFEVETLS